MYKLKYSLSFVECLKALHELKEMHKDKNIMIKLTHVTKVYLDDQNEQVTALNDVSLQFPETGLVVISGTSGCGKTTLLNILGGLDKPTSGEVYLEDTRIDNENECWWDSFRGSSLGFIYQDFNLLEHMTVQENIHLPLALQSIDEKTRQDRINEIIEKLGLKEYLEKKAGKLSGGQKQRVAIARALVTGSKIILADEPTGNLDKENSENVFRILKEIAKTRLVVVVTHDATLAAEYADRLIQIAYGTIESDKVVEENVGKTEKTDEKAISTGDTSRRLSWRECLKFATEAMRQRKARCFVSIMIFSITMLFILLICQAVFRDDSVSMTEYLLEKEQIAIPLYVAVPDAYRNLAEEEQITSGKNLYDVIGKDIDTSRLFRAGWGEYIFPNETTRVDAQSIFVGQENEKYFTYEGIFPKKANEIAIASDLAKELGNPKDMIGSKLALERGEYTVTAIVTQICDKDIDDIYVDDGWGENLFKKLILFSNEALIEMKRSSPLYISGFGVTAHTDPFYQVTIYNDVRPVSDKLNLITGRMPKSKNEVVISESLYEYGQQLSKNLLNKPYRLKNLYDSKYGCSYWNMLNLYDYMGDNITIVGVVDGSDDYYILPSVYEQLYEKYRIYHEYPYYIFADEEVLQKDIQKLSADDVRIKGNDFDKVYDLIMNIEMLKIGLFIAVAILGVLSVLQMISLYSYSINDNKKTIGVLRTLGVNKADTKRIFTVECVVVSVTSYVIALIVNVFVISMMNDFISQNIFEFEGLDFLRMRFIIVLIAGIISCVLSVLSVLIPLRKYSKMKIIELIK